MKLEKFRVSNYRSVKDSGWIDVGQQTALVGRNESGKSNLLRALRCLKPPDQLERLSVSSDFPNDRLRTEYSEELDVIETVWALEEAEREHLGQIFPRARDVSHVEVGRGYEPLRWVRFASISEVEAPVEEGRKLYARIANTAEAEEGHDDLAFERAMRNLDSALTRPNSDPRLWAEGVREALTELRQPADSHSFPLDEGAREAIAQLVELTEQVANDNAAEQVARDWVLQQLPTFLYLDDYPDIQGEQDLSAYVERQRENRPREGDEYFQKLLEVAGLDDSAVQSLLNADHEMRRQLANRAGAAVTRKLRELWNERPIKVRFHLDGEHFNTLISDPNSIYDVEVNLNERSRGFRWFFSFYVTFAADAKSGTTENTILLLDEPGLHLHALGQRDLLNHFKSDFQNQVLFSTHSPFMVPADDLACVRTVTISEEGGTCVSNSPAADERTLFPILHSIGVEVAQGLLHADWSLVVEEITDYWYLRSVSDYVREKRGVALPRNLQIVPTGGSASVPYMVALLTGREQKAVVLLDEDPLKDGSSGDAVKELLAQQANGVLIESGFSSERMGGADIEDLIDPQLYDRFVRYCYRNELKDRDLKLDEEIPRIVDRYSAAFDGMGIEFSRARQARLFLRGMGKNPATVLPKATRERFERLFTAVRKKIEQLREA